MNPSFRESVEEINELEIITPLHPIAESSGFNKCILALEDGQLLPNVNVFGRLQPDPRRRRELFKLETPIFRYVESMNKPAFLRGFIVDIPCFDTCRIK